MQKATFTAGFTVVSLTIIAAGALQCFAPKKMKEIQDKLSPPGDYSNSAPGSLLEKFRQDEVGQPPWMYRFSGFMVMSIGAFALVIGLLILWR
jgi:hypothetical protein